MTDGSAANWDELDVFVPIEYSKPMFEDDDDGATNGTDSGGFGGGGGGGFSLDLQTGSEEAFFDSHAYEFNFTLSPEDLSAYFCDPNTHLALAQGSTSHQGSVVSICFDVEDGKIFEVEDIIDLHVVDAGGSKQEVAIFVGGEVAETHYGEKACLTNLVDSNIRTCVARFLLKAEFYDYQALALHGFGSLLLRVENRRQLVGVDFGRRELFENAVAGYQVRSQHFKTYNPDERNSAATSRAHQVVMTMVTSWVIAWGAARL